MLPNEIDIMTRVNGTRNVTQIALEAGIEPERAMEVVGRLVKVGVLNLKSQPPRVARLVARLATERLPRESVGIDAGIVSAWQRSMGVRPERIACKRKNGEVLTFVAEPIENLGPYLHVTREMLFQTGLKAEETVLVKPVVREGSA